jgi:hypothetical protein
MAASQGRYGKDADGVDQLEQLAPTLAGLTS